MAQLMILLHLWSSFTHLFLSRISCHSQSYGCCFRCDVMFLYVSLWAPSRWVILYCWGIRGIFNRLFLSLEKREAEQKVWLQVFLLRNAIEKSNTVDVSTRQHRDKRLRWLRPNYAQPWQQGMSKHKWKQIWPYTKTHLHREQRHRTEVNIYTGSASSCGTNTCREKQLRQVEWRKHIETYWIFHNVFTGLSRVQEVQFVCLCIFEKKYADNFVLFLVCLCFCTCELVTRSDGPLLGCQVVK